MLSIFTKKKEFYWDSWFEYQKKYGIPEKCDSIEYYIKNYFVIKVPRDNEYYDNFGVFSYFLLSKNASVIKELIHFYDNCKGYARYFTGDPNYISLLRKFSEDEDINVFNSINFEDYLYDYNKIHAYTVASFSLSNLIMRLAIHHIPKNSDDDNLMIFPSNKDLMKRGKIFEEIEIKQICPGCKRICENLIGDNPMCIECQES